MNLGGHSKYEVSKYLYDVASNHMDAIATVTQSGSSGLSDRLKVSVELGKYLNPGPSTPLPFPTELTSPPMDWRLSTDNRQQRPDDGIDSSSQRSHVQ